MQLIPATAERFNVRQPFNAEQNIHGGLAYLRWLKTYYAGDTVRVLAAYNAGEGAVERHGGLPPFAETVDYVRKVRRLYPVDEHPFDATLTRPSRLASFGVVAAVFEWGWLADALHVTRTGPVISFMPIILMGVLFGLAMDYEVFLVSRMREDFVHARRAAEASGQPYDKRALALAAVRSGFTASARVVTAAAVIMFAVFAAFVPEGDTSIKPIALGLAVGIAVDAFVVRMTLVPAVMALLGDKAWWMPRWLDRVLPHFDIEGEAVYTMTFEALEVYAGALPVLYENFEEERELGLSLEFGVSYKF
jgi:uncharacterized membrane protein YdfJ with MMPL/SSD domain